MTTSVLKITDGTVTKNFSTGDNMKLIRYEPLSSAGSGELISESAEVHFTAAIATNRANIQAINKLFDQARNYERTQTGARVYIEFDPGSSGTAWRSRLLTGRVVLNDTVLGPWQYDTRLKLTIEWTREPFWEGALTQIPLTNASATDDTAGITVTNRTDGGTCQVETAVIVGTITGDGNATVTTTAAGMTGSPIATGVAVLNGDTATQVATKMAAALNLDANITALFNVASSAANLVLTRLVPAANDATLNIAYTNDTCTGLTPDATSNDTTAGSTTAHENWVKIDGVNDLTGDLPAPVKIQMYNASNVDETDEIYVFHNVYSTPNSLDHILEGEDATGGTVTDVADGSSSGGFYGQLAWAATTETKIATWAISSAQLEYMAGGRFAILARWAAAFPYSSGCYLRFKLEGVTGVLYEGDLVQILDTRELHLLDSLRLPPYLYGLADVKGINLCLYGWRNESGTHTLKLDFLQLSPISGDGGWKRFDAVSNGVDYQEYFIHDATERFDYRVDTSGDKIADFTPYGGPVLLVPGVDNQKLYFLSCDYSGVQNVNQSWTVKLWYRSRRDSL